MKQVVFSKNRLSDQIRISRDLSQAGRKRIAINGFGRFSLHLIRDWLLRSEDLGFDVQWINDPLRTVEEIANELAQDTILGSSISSIVVLSGRVLINDKHSIQISHEKEIINIPWQNEIDWVFECSGRFTDRKSTEKHLRGNIERVIISATSLTADKILVLGVNESEYDPYEHRIISYGSCTINGYLPIARVLNDSFEIEESGLNVTHNTPIKDIRPPYGTLLRRVCTLEYVAPRLIQALEGRFFVNYHLVPYPGVSLMDFEFRFKNEISSTKLLSRLQEAAQGEIDLHLSFTQNFDRPEQFIANFSSVVLIEESFRKVGSTHLFSAWFDNENSAVRLNDLAAFMTTKEVSLARETSVLAEGMA